MVVYICQCYSLSSSHPLLPLLCPHTHSPCLHLYSCPANRFICAILSRFYTFGIQVCNMQHANSNVTCGILLRDQGSNLHRECGVLATGPPGKSPNTQSSHKISHTRASLRERFPEALQSPERPCDPEKVTSHSLPCFLRL